MQMAAMLQTISQLNSLDHASFVRAVGPVFEQSPWIAEAAWSKRPFASVAALHSALCQVVREAGDEKQLALICAHPDLVGRAVLTSESANEQASAGLDRLGADDIELFRRSNAAYRGKFGFPFVICARLNRKQAILESFERRLKNSREEEIRAALAEIFKIAELRLHDLTHG